MTYSRSFVQCLADSIARQSPYATVSTTKRRSNRVDIIIAGVVKIELSTAPGSLVISSSYIDSKVRSYLALQIYKAVPGMIRAAYEPATREYFDIVENFMPDDLPAASSSGARWD